MQTKQQDEDLKRRVIKSEGEKLNVCKANKQLDEYLRSLYQVLYVADIWRNFEEQIKERRLVIKNEREKLNMCNLYLKFNVNEP